MGFSASGGRNAEMVWERVEPWLASVEGLGCRDLAMSASCVSCSPARPGGISTARRLSRVKRDRLYRIDIHDDGVLAFDMATGSPDRDGQPMKRVAILVTHLLGTGHLSRALTLARALRDAGLAPAAHLGRHADWPSGHCRASISCSSRRFVRTVPASRACSTARAVRLAPNSCSERRPRARARRSAMSAGRAHHRAVSVRATGTACGVRGGLAAATRQRSRRRHWCFRRSATSLAPPSSDRKAAQTEAWLAATLRRRTGAFRCRRAAA